MRWPVKFSYRRGCSTGGPIIPIVFEEVTAGALSSDACVCRKRPAHGKHTHLFTARMAAISKTH